MNVYILSKSIVEIYLNGNYISTDVCAYNHVCALCVNKHTTKLAT